MHFDAWFEMLVFIMIFAGIILVPCTFVAWLGRKLINRLGRWPSQAPAIHMGVCGGLIFIEIVTFTLIFLFIQLFPI